MNFLIYLECLFVNKVSRAAVFFAVIGGVLMYAYDWHILPLICFVIGGLLFLVTGFGLNSYLMCKTAYRLISIRGLPPAIPSAPCDKAAFKVAIRMHTGSYPEIANDDDDDD